MAAKRLFFSMIKRFQFSVAALLRCILFSGLAFGLMMILYRWEPPPAVAGQPMPSPPRLLFFLQPAALAAAGAAVGALLGRTGLFGFVGLSYYWCGRYFSLLFLVLLPATGIDTGWLRWGILVPALSAFPALLLAVWRPRWAGLWLLAGGLIWVLSSTLSLTMPFLANPTPRIAGGHMSMQGIGTLMQKSSLLANILLSLAMMAFGFRLFAACTSSRMTGVTATSRRRWLGWWLLGLALGPLSLIAKMPLIIAPWLVGVMLAVGPFLALSVVLFGLSLILGRNSPEIR